MPKIPWTPPKRPPRIRREEPTAEFAPVSGEDRCDVCVGMGSLYKQMPGSRDRTEIECWVCKGTGKQLPAPQPNDDLFAAPPWPETPTYKPGPVADEGQWSKDGRTPLNRGSKRRDQ